MQDFSSDSKAPPDTKKLHLQSNFSQATSIEGTDDSRPEAFTLSQNYPNPFNPTTSISYQIPANTDVRLEVFNMLGQSVALLVNEQKAAGTHSISFDATGLTSGIYIYRTLVAPGTRSATGGIKVSRKYGASGGICSEAGFDSDAQWDKSKLIIELYPQSKIP